MTTGFQQQHMSFGPILKAAARPHQVGTKLKPDEGRELIVAPEKRSFAETRTSR